MSELPVLAIRTTCSTLVGFGHLRRCLTLAAEAARNTRPVLLLVADARGRELAAESGLATESVDETIDATRAALERIRAAALIVDDYALTPAAISDLQAAVGNVLMLDDGARRQLEVDAILDANPAAPANPYAVPPGGLQLLGPRFALLRQEFRGLPARKISGDVRHVLFTIGGSNPGNRTESLVLELLEGLPGVTIDVVAGPLFSGGLPVDERVVVHRSPRTMVDLMLRADLAVAAGGQTTYELAACGVPTVALCVADNQRANLDALAAVPTLHVATDIDVTAVAATLAGDHARRRELAAAGQKLIDGLGAQRAWDALAARWFGVAA